jgi:glycerophosphoryl diester phosphodiesterase
MKLLLISFASVLVFFFGLFGVQQWGLSTPYQRFEHAFMNGQNPKISVNVHKQSEAEKVIAAKPDAILWLDIRFTKDRRFVILAESEILATLVEKNLGANSWKGSYINRYGFDEIRALFPQAPLLEDMLNAFPQSRFILNIVDNVPEIHTDLVKHLEPFQLDERVLIQSDTDIIMKSIKTEKPKWLYGTSHADLMRLMSFDSVAILSATPFGGDVLIAPVTIKKRDGYNMNIVNEIHRRKKDVFLGPINTLGEYDAVRQNQPDGIVFSSAELFLAYLDQKSL